MDITNAKKELLAAVGDKKIIWAKLAKDYSYETDSMLQIVLAPDYTIEQYNEFLNNINFKYDSGFGGQELYGFVALENGEWLEREEYDGAENWALKAYPKFENIISRWD